MKNTLVKQRYRKDLTKAAMLRAAAICRYNVERFNDASNIR